MTPRFKSSSSGSTPWIPFDSCWAKTDTHGQPGLTVLEHCTIVGAVARALRTGQQLSVVEGLVGQNPGLVAALHDIGKISPGFQLKYFREALKKVCPELVRREHAGYCDRHALISEAALNQHMGGAKGSPVARIAGRHHGERSEAPLRDTGSRFGGPSWSEQRQLLIGRLEGVFGPLPEPDLSPAQEAFLSGLVSVSDWIGSDEALFPPGQSPSLEGLERKAEEAVRACGWRPLDLREGLSFADIFKNTPYAMQQTFAETVDGPGLYILEAPTGMGKTEAALYATYRLMASGTASGLYFGLPTRLTSNRIHERVNKFLKEVCKDYTPARLAHSSAWLNAFAHGRVNREEGESGSTWFDSRKRALLHPFGVGTIDQALLGVIKVKHFFVRLFGLAGKVVILDEVHSYDMYTGTLLDRLVSTLLQLNCTVIILSATLTRARRTQLLQSCTEDAGEQAYPLISAKTADRSYRISADPPPPLNIRVQMLDWAPADVAEDAVAHASRGECVLCIANTVAKAQEWYSEIKSRMAEDDFNTGLLHSKFLGWRREHLECIWTKHLGPTEERPGGCVLVATQVVEQSVDLDADYLITELAPTDMLLQRMGRMWRHDRAARPCPEPVFSVLAGALDSAKDADEFVEMLGRSNALIYAPYVLWRSWQVWSQQSSVERPTDVRELLEDTYSEADEEEPFIQLLKEQLAVRRKRLGERAFAALAEVQGLPTMSDDDRAATRYSDLPTTDALIVRAFDCTGLDATIELLEDQPPVRVNAFQKDLAATARLHQNVVSIPSYRLPKVGLPKCLQKHFFGPVAVLVRTESGNLLHDGRATGFQYDDERGLQRNAETAASAWSVRLGENAFTYSDYDMEDGPNEFEW